jgi:hypothetical protein
MCDVDACRALDTSLAEMIGRSEKLKVAIEQRAEPDSELLLVCENACLLPL